MVGYFEDALRQFPDRFINGAGQPYQQHDTGKNANTARNKIHSKSRCKPGMAAGLSGSVAVRICRFTTESVTSRIIMPARTPTLISILYEYS